jgi:hypothetical protein
MSKENSLEDWRVIDKRFVAFLDIMGFKDMVARNSLIEVYKKMAELSIYTTGISQADFSKDKIHQTMFSDSIILFSKDDSNEAAYALTYAVRYIMCRAIGLKLGIKGGIAFGELTVDQGRQVYCGQPLIDAYLLEEELQYYGVVLHHTAEEKVLSLPHPFPKLNFFNMPTKLRQGIVNHINVNWFDLARNVREQQGYNLHQYLNAIKLTVSGAPRRYLDNTMEALVEEEKNYKKILEEVELADKLKQQIEAKPMLENLSVNQG